MAASSDQGDVRIDARLDAVAAADVGRHDETQPVLWKLQHPRHQRMHDERPHEVGPDGEDLLEGIPARDDGVGLDGRGRVLGEPEALADHDLRVAERLVRIAVDEPPAVGQVGADRLVKDGGAGLQRPLGIDHGGKRLVVDDHALGGVLGAVTIAPHHQCHRFSHEADLVGGRAVVADGRGDAHAEGLGALGDVGPGDHPDDAGHGESGRHVVAEEARVGVGRADDGRVASAGEGVVVEILAAPGEQMGILHPLHPSSNPAFARRHPRDVSFTRACARGVIDPLQTLRALCGGCQRSVRARSLGGTTPLRQRRWLSKIRAAVSARLEVGDAVRQDR